MFLTLTLIVVIASICMFFSQEFASLFNKIANIPGVKLLAPLVLASWVIERYENWVLWSLLKLKGWFHYVILELAKFLPFEMAAISVTHALHIFLLTILPMLVLHIVAKTKPRYELWPHTYLLGMMTWITLVILLSVHHPVQ